MLPEGFEARMRALLGSEYEDFLASFDRPLCTGLRRNPLKTGFTGDLSRFSLSPVPWCPTGFYYDAVSRPGLSPYHAAGLYYLQEPSAMAPAELLDPQPGERVLDLCAAPGGKSTQLAGKLRGKGLLVCNEITPGNFTFRTREFEQMECEFFCKPGTDLEWFAYWKDYCVNWLKSLGIREENLRLRDHEPAELAFYSRATTDIEYAFPFTDWGELWGIADRTDYDLKRHQEASGKDLTYFDQEANEHYIPYVIEPSLGCDRVALAFLCEAYDEEVIDEAKNDVRVVLHLHPALAPYKAAILPLSKKLAEPARKIYQDLCGDFMLDYDDTGSIGKRYRREDEIGTPYCITVDFATVGDDKTPADNAVTIRERDSMEQVRVPISELKNWLAEHTKF